MKLNGSATMEDFTFFFINKVIPAYEKELRGVKGVRGESRNSFGVLWLFNSKQARDKYFNADGSTNEAGKAAVEKLVGVGKELDRIETYEAKYTDWVVQ